MFEFSWLDSLICHDLTRSPLLRRIERLHWNTVVLDVDLGFGIIMSEAPLLQIEPKELEFICECIFIFRILLLFCAAMHADADVIEPNIIMLINWIIRAVIFRLCSWVEEAKFMLGSID